MKTSGNNFLILLALLSLQFYACQPLNLSSAKTALAIPDSKRSGGSSGMAMLGDQSYIVVYDVKNFRTGVRMGMISIKDEMLEVNPIKVNGWGVEGISSDLESICKIPAKTAEYLIAESGNWKGALGRIFHIRVDTTARTAQVLGITKLPYQDINTPDKVGDQYEAMGCLPYSDTKRILILAERGGSSVNPSGIIKWGMYDLTTHQLEFSNTGSKGISVDAPGDWTDIEGKRDITDLHIDEVGGIWAAASEDVSEVGPFYSVIYKLGQLDATNTEQPFQIYKEFPQWQAVTGFKIEALSGPIQYIDCTHAFGTEDEIYGGVWRAITMKED